MKQQTVLAILVMFSIASWAGTGNSAQENFEINLKDLRTAPVDTGNIQKQRPRRSDAAQAQSLSVKAKSEGSSSYTARPGDNLFIILMRHYNLSNEAAERLVPEVMHLNSIHNPQALSIGQRLIIPLPAPPERQTKSNGKQPDPPPPQTAQPKAPAPQTAPQPPVQSKTDHKLTPAAKTSREGVNAASSCSLAHEILTKLNLLVTPAKLISGDDALTAEHAGLKVVITCGLSSDKTYTYERLLAQDNMQLLVFTGTESGRYVIRKLANRLSLLYKLTESDTAGGQQATYIFPAIGPNGQDISITIDSENGG